MCRICDKINVHTIETDGKYVVCRRMVLESLTYHTIILDVPDTPRVNILEDQFNTEYIKLVLEWPPSSNRPTTYSVNVVPQVNVNFTERTSVQLNVPYNTQHNVSVVATLCYVENRRTTKVYYGEPNITM